MKTFLLKILGVIFFAFLIIGCNSETNVVSAETEASLLKSEQSGTGYYDLSQEKIEGLIHMRIEEKLARDVYTVLGEKWNARVFLNIKLSEQTHMEAVRKLLNKYGISDPITTDEIGVFPDLTFQALYGQLIIKGNESLQEAFKVGVSIEELDIENLNYQLNTVVDNPDIIRVYSNLKAGSENHLTAFKRNLTSIGSKISNELL